MNKSATHPRALQEVLEDVVLAIVANYPQLSGAETIALKARLIEIIADRDLLEPGPAEIACLLRQVMTGPRPTGDGTAKHHTRLETVMRGRLEDFVDMWLSQNVGPGPSLSPNDNELIDLTDCLTTDAINAAFPRSEVQSFGPMATRIAESRRIANSRRDDLV